MGFIRLCRALALCVLVNASYPAWAASVIQFSATRYPVAEDIGIAKILVIRTNDLETAVSVAYATRDSTATNGIKYTAVSGVLSFGAGITNQEIAVPILNTGFVEGIKTFSVSLSDPTGGAVLGSRVTATVQILDNDSGVAFEFKAYSVGEAEGAVQVGVVRGDDGDFPISVECQTFDVTARNGADYLGLTNTVVFIPPQRVQVLNIPVINDGLLRTNPVFRLVLSKPQGGAVLGAVAQTSITIVDNDPGVQFVQNQLWVREQDGQVQLSVTRGNDQRLDGFTVDYTTVDGTAKAGLDYTESKGTLSFGPGQATSSFEVRLIDDGVAKLDRQFNVQLSNLVC